MPRSDSDLSPPSVTDAPALRWRVALPFFALAVSVGAGAALLLSQTSAAPPALVLSAAAASAALMVAAFLLLGAQTGRVRRVRHTAEMLRDGHRTARTQLEGRDEVARMGQSLDAYADYTQDKQDELRASLRRKRRELTHLLAVLEAMPDGVIVQDTSGRVMLMNARARELLGSQRVFRSSGLHELTALVTDTLGLAIAPGIYALGDPYQVTLNGKVLSAQAASVVSALDEPLGSVVLLRDMSGTVRQEQQRDALIKRLEEQVQQPLSDLARRRGRSGIVTELMLRDFVREITRHTGTLGKTIADLRELADVDAVGIERDQTAIPLETLVWSIVNEWRQIATMGGIQLRVQISVKGLYVLGDERRLRWALGNLVDNGIKYTPMGGVMLIEILGSEDGMAHLRLRDTGAGISPQDMPRVFTRFYRGTPRAEGQVIHVPGMGQGLTIARQIIEAHGGTLRLKSKVDVGTAVYVSLPLTAPVGLELPRLGVDADDIDGETVPVEGRRSHRSD